MHRIVSVPYRIVSYRIVVSYQDMHRIVGKRMNAALDHSVSPHLGTRKKEIKHSEESKTKATVIK